MPDVRMAAEIHHGLLGFGLQEVPIFNNHGLSKSVPLEVPKTTRQYFVSPITFRSHLRRNRDECFTTPILDEREKPASADESKTRIAALTFGGGLASDYEIASQSLAESGMRATLFLNTATIEKAGYLNWSKVVEMQRHGMPFESRNHRHVDLTLLSKPEVDGEPDESKDCLEDHLDCQVIFIVAPHGLSDQSLDGRTLTVEYRAVCKTSCWSAYPFLRMLTRINIHRDIHIRTFRAFLAGNLLLFVVRLLPRMINRLGARVGVHGVLRHRLLELPATISK